MWAKELERAMACAVRLLGPVVIDTVYGCEDGIIFNTSSFDVYKWVSDEDALYVLAGQKAYGLPNWKKV